MDLPPPLFADRREAGERLARELRARQLVPEQLLAVPRGGVVVAAEIARALGCPLDVVLARKIGAPGQRELAIGAAVSDDPEPLLDQRTIEHLGVPAAYLEAEIAAQRIELDRQLRLYRGDRPPPVRGRVVALVDDGVATGATLRAALRSLRRQQPARLIVAVPVAPAATVERLAAEADEVVCLATPEPFYAVGCAYADFRQVTDDEVCRLLATARGQQGGAP